MPKCRICEHENSPTAERCTNCSAWLDNSESMQRADNTINRDSAAATDRDANEPSADAVAPNETSPNEVLQLLRAGKKIDAIKLHRNETGCGLKEAKDAVEALGRKHGIAPTKSGCAGMLLGIAAALLLVVAGFSATTRALDATPFQPTIEGSHPRKVMEVRYVPDDTQRTPSRAQKLLNEDRVLVIAHRGDSKVAPENTLPAFTSALKVGVDFVEFDYYHTADGIPITIHDNTLDRTTNAETRFHAKKIPITSKTLAELAPLDAGAWHSAPFVGTKLPTVAETLTTILPGAVPLIERKGGDAKTMVEYLQAKKIVGDCVVQAFDWEYLADCRKLAPDLVLGALGKEALTAEKLDQVTKFAAAFVGWSEKDLTKENIAAAHAKHLKVFAFTVDDPQRANQLIDAGLDGVITNVPTTIKKTIAARQPR